MLRVSTLAIRLTAAVAAVSFLVSASGTTCFKSSNGCSSRTALKEYTGQPTVPCQNGHPVVQITSRAWCGSATAGPVVVLRCGTFSDGFSYTGTNGTVHTIGTTSNWETVLADNCQDLTYSAN